MTGFLQDLANVIKTDAAKDIFPVIAADIAAIQANPDLVLNPLNQVVEFAKLQNDLLSAVSPSGQFDKDIVSDVLGLAVAYVVNVKIPLAVAAKAAAPK